MSETRCTAPVPFEELIAYWLGELAPAEGERIDEHIILCGACSARLGEIAELAQVVRSVFRNGDIHAILTPAFLDRVVGQGVRVRQYRCARNGSIACSIAPEDELLVGRLEAPLAGVGRLDILSRRSCEEAEHRFAEIPFDPGAGEIVVVPNLTEMRLLPSHQHFVRLIAVDANGERVLGEYIFNHSAHSERSGDGGD